MKNKETTGHNGPKSLEDAKYSIRTGLRKMFAGIFSLLAQALVVMFLWNLAISPVFGAPPVGYITSVAGIFMVRLLTGSMNITFVVNKKKNQN